MLTVITSFQVFTQAYVLTTGDRARVAPTPGVLVVRKGVHDYAMGYASAIAWVLFLIVIVLTIVQLRLAAALGPLRSMTGSLTTCWFGNWMSTVVVRRLRGAVGSFPIRAWPSPYGLLGLADRVADPTALKPEADAFDNSLGSFATYGVRNFVTAWDYGPSGGSCQRPHRSTCGAFLTLATSLLSGYAFARLHFAAAKVVLHLRGDAGHPPRSPGRPVVPDDAGILHWVELLSSLIVPGRSARSACS